VKKSPLEGLFFLTRIKLRMKNFMSRFDANTVLLYVGFTILLPLLFPISAVFQWLMSQSVSMVWSTLHPQTYSILRILFVYGISVAATHIFMVKMAINKRLQPHYVSPRWWATGCGLFLLVLTINTLGMTGLISLTVSDQQLLGGVSKVMRIILLIACARVLIGILPRANKAVTNSRKPE
jgi:hypothetical protein